MPRNSTFGLLNINSLLNTLPVYDYDLGRKQQAQHPVVALESVGLNIIGRLKIEPSGHTHEDHDNHGTFYNLANTNTALLYAVMIEDERRR